jgi:FkbM family methyltransferase
MSIKGAIREIFGNHNYLRLQSFRKRFAPSETVLKIGKFDIRFPKGHILPSIWQANSKRNLALGMAAAELSKKYPGEELLDIGANVGDTAALLASFSTSPLILVEPSDLYFSFLKENAVHFPNRVSALKAFVFSTPPQNGRLVHEAGTAHFEIDSVSANDIPHILLKNLGNPRLIKIDTDGFDFDIILGSVDFLSEKMPVLYFENAIYDFNALETANRTANVLTELGYEVLVFTALGAHVCTTSSSTVLHDLNRFLYRSASHLPPIPLYYYDLLCFPRHDADISLSISEYFRGQ